MAMYTNSAPYDEASWGDTLRNYRKSTNNVPWGNQQFVPTKRETVHEKSRQERQFDPITMKYRDDTKESLVQERERAFAAVRVNDAKDKQLCFEQKFNIINHRSHLPKEYEDKNRKTAMMNEVKRRAPDSRVKYNIISHMGKEEHHTAKMVPREGEEFTLRRSMNVTMEGGMKPKSHQTREFDVLTNKYIENNTAREVEDLEVRSWRMNEREPTQKTHSSRSLVKPFRLLAWLAALFTRHPGSEGGSHKEVLEKPRL